MKIKVLWKSLSTSPSTPPCCRLHCGAPWAPIIAPRLYFLLASHSLCKVTALPRCKKINHWLKTTFCALSRSGWLGFNYTKLHYIQTEISTFVEHSTKGKFCICKYMNICQVGHRQWMCCGWSLTYNENYMHERLHLKNEKKRNTFATCSAYQTRPPWPVPPVQGSMSTAESRYFHMCALSLAKKGFSVNTWGTHSNHGQERCKPIQSG